jgi:hypothetical protein
LVGDAGEIRNAEELQASATFDIVRHSLSETVDRILAVADGSRGVDELRTEAALAKVGNPACPWRHPTVVKVCTRLPSSLRYRWVFSELIRTRATPTSPYQI